MNGHQSTTADLDPDNDMTPPAIVQWTIRFCLEPANLPAFCLWVRSIWPACPYTDEQILDSLTRIHDLTKQLLG